MEYIFTVSLTQIRNQTAIMRIVWKNVLKLYRYGQPSKNALIQRSNVYWEIWSTSDLSLQGFSPIWCIKWSTRTSDLLNVFSHKSQIQIKAMKSLVNVISCDFFESFVLFPTPPPRTYSWFNVWHSHGSWQLVSISNIWHDPEVNF